MATCSVCSIALHSSRLLSHRLGDVKRQGTTLDGQVNISTCWCSSELPDLHSGSLRLAPSKVVLRGPWGRGAGMKARSGRTGCCCRDVPLCWHHQLSAFLMREMSSLSPLQSIQPKNTAVLRESKSPLLSLAHVARTRMLKSASYPKSDVSSVVLCMY